MRGVIGAGGHMVLCPSLQDEVLSCFLCSLVLKGEDRP